MGCLTSDIPLIKSTVSKRKVVILILIWRYFELMRFHKIDDINDDTYYYKKLAFKAQNQKKHWKELAI